MYVRFNAEARSRTADLARVPLVLPGAGGQSTTLPLGQVATITRELGPAQINHLDRERVINVEANTQDRPLSEVVGDITTRLESVRMPVGYQLTFGGDTEDQTEVFGRIMFALLVAVMLMYLILVVQFGSFLDPLAILLSLPLSLIGVVLGLWIAGSTLNLMSMIGIIMLMGIVAKNAILLIDFAKWAKESGQEHPRRADRGGRHPAAADPDDHVRADRGHASRGAGPRRGRAVPRPDGHRHHRRRGRRRRCSRCW